MFKAMMTSAEIGLSSYGTDISKLCMEFLCSLATEVANKNLKDTEAYSVLAVFLKVKDNPNLCRFCILCPDEIILIYSGTKKELLCFMIKNLKKFGDSAHKIRDKPFLRKKEFMLFIPETSFNLLSVHFLVYSNLCESEKIQQCQFKFYFVANSADVVVRTF